MLSHKNVTNALMDVKCAQFRVLGVFSTMNRIIKGVQKKHKPTTNI